MKTIIMLGVAILLAVSVNAASVVWSAAGMNNYVGNAYQVFVIGQNGVTDIDTVTGLLDQGKSVSMYAIGSGNIASNGAGTNATTGTQPTLGSGTYTSFMVLFNTADAENAFQYVVLSGKATQTQTIGESTAKVTFGAANVSSIVNNTENWKKGGPGSSIPEPTSGLLLLVGGALIALRRKQK